MKKIIFLFLFFVSTAHAIEVEIPLVTHKVGPYEILNVAIDLPARSTEWEVYCFVNSEPQKESITQMSLGHQEGFLDARFNGQSISFPFQPIFQQNNVLKILYQSFITIPTLLTFKNTSANYSFNVTRCYAHRYPR